MSDVRDDGYHGTRGQAVISPTEDDMLGYLRDLLLSVLPTGFVIDWAQANRVSEPNVDDYALFLAVGRVRLGTSWEDYADDGTKTIVSPMQVDVQVDVHGPLAGDNVQLIDSVFNSDIAFYTLQAASNAVAPLYSSDPSQTAFINAEEAYETKWTIVLSVEMNQGVTIALTVPTEGPLLELDQVETTVEIV